MKYRRNNDYVLREIVGDAFLIPTGKASEKINGMITLNGMSAFIWKKLENSTTFDELIHSILEEYEVDEETARNDISVYLENMTKVEMVFAED